MSKSHLITELNTKVLVHALTVIKTFHDRINLHQAMMTPITVMPRVVAAYSLSPWNSTQACGTKKDDKNTSFMNWVSPSNSIANFNNEQCHGDKRDPATPDGINEKVSTCQKQKKPCCTEGRYRCKGEDRSGIFYLCNTLINPSDVFPKDMPNKNCFNFTCKGEECNNVNCNFIHPRRPSEFKCETILAIANHFTKRDLGWFNKYHFMKMPNITDEIKKFLGPNSKLAWRGVEIWELHEFPRFS